MTLTSQEAELLSSSDRVPLIIDGEAYVLVRQDIFAKLAPVDYDDRPWTDEERASLAEAMMDGLDSAPIIP